MMSNTICKRSKVKAVNVITGEARKDTGQPTKPRIFTVESVDNNEMRLYQVGSYEVPLKFSLSTGLPYLAEHSRSSMVYKLWKNYRVELYVNDSEPSSP